MPSSATPSTSGGNITKGGTAHGRPAEGRSREEKLRESRRKTAWERKQVWEGRATRTSTGMTKKDLVRKSDGHIASRAKSALAKKQSHLGSHLGKGF
jgi:hypothetical protein